MNTQESNKIIAEFMEVVQHPEHKKYWNVFSQMYMPELLYHKSWDWLMPVVEKIEALGFCVWFQTRKKAPIVISVLKMGLDDIIYIGSVHETKIQSVFAAIVKFIIWYNSQNNSEAE